ncbi:MAG: ABC transporter permease [Patescibacteria group bacterium]|nr:ABC transporter permease [Patescibacteria group bacterium]
MKFSDALTLSTRMFKNRPMRTFLTILGVSVGIGTVLFLVSLGYGLQKVILERITTADSLLSLDVSPGVSSLVELTQDNVDKIAKIDGVVETSRLANISSQINLGDKTANGAVMAADQSFFRLNGVNASYGKIISSDDSLDAVISTAALKLFDLSQADAIGKQIQLTLYTTSINSEGFEEVKIVKRDDNYTIVGITEDENSVYVYVPLKSIADVNISKFDQLKAKIVNNSVMESVRTQIIAQGFLVSSLSDTIDQANKIFQVIQIILFSFGFIALLVSAIGMFNTMTISLLEKTNEIGIMRSLGITGKDIRAIFFMESGIMGFLGGFGGVAVGYFAGVVVNFGFNILARNLGGKALALFYTPSIFIFFIIFFSTIVGLLTGIFPSYRASKLNPLDALRYK